MKCPLHVAALLSLLAFSGARLSVSAQTASPSRGDGIFTPTVTAVAPIDKTGRPITIEVRQPEPRLASSMIAGNPTGDSYIIHFPQGDAGGPCIYSGTARYLIESGGELTFQALADCGKLRRGYSYMICRLDASLRCTEAPWWNFRDRSYVITQDGVTVNGSARPSPGEIQRMLRNSCRNVRENQIVERPHESDHCCQHRPWPLDFLPRVSSRIEVLSHLGISNHVPHQQCLRRNAQPRIHARWRPNRLEFTRWELGKTAEPKPPTSQTGYAG